MANVISVSLGTLVDRALRDLRNHHEIGRSVSLLSTIDATVTTFQVSDATLINVTDVLEFSDELLFVTAKSDDSATATLTAARGYFGSLAQAHTAGKVGLINPLFSRRVAQDGVLRSISAIESTEGLPLLKTEAYTPVVDPFDSSTGQLVVTLPTDTRDVWYVRHGLQDVPRWRFYDNVTTATYTNGRVLTLPLGWDASDTVAVTRQVPYRWSTHPAAPTEADTIELVEGAEFLPSCYATAYLLTGREHSRTQLDRSEEFAQTEPVRGGVSRSIARDAWQTFYRKLDEARRLDPPVPPQVIFRPWVA